MFIGSKIRNFIKSWLLRTRIIKIKDVLGFIKLRKETKEYLETSFLRKRIKSNWE
jgi:hypothetical protein